MVARVKSVFQIRKVLIIKVTCKVRIISLVKKEVKSKTVHFGIINCLDIIGYRIDEGLYVK